MKKSRSERYIELASELHDLRIYLLPRTFNTEGNYTEEELIKTLAFRVLAYAELESYIEDRALDVAKAAAKAWKGNKMASCTLMGLIAFSGREMESPPDTLKPAQPNRTKEWADKVELSNKISLAMQSFTNALSNNHGIRERNLLNILLPVGIDVNTLDQTWLLDMDNFGKMRGDAAHRSTKKIYTTQQINPENEWKAVKSLLRTGLCKIDDTIELILKEIESNRSDKRSTRPSALWPKRSI